MRKKILLTLVQLICLVTLVTAQKDSILSDNGRLSARIYGDFKCGLNSSTKSTAFEISRVYLGYSRSITNHLSGEVKFDIGSPEDESQYSLIRRYAYFKTAALTYNKGKYTLWCGLFDMQQFKEQEKFWDHRYLFKSYMDEYKFGPSADIGIGISYRFTPVLSADLVISNGEGYKMLQTDTYYKYGGGLSWKPGKLILRAYYDITGIEYPQMNSSVFAGYKVERFRLGAEAIYQTNYKNYEGYMRYGYSVYSLYQLADRWEILGRYDQIYSNILSGEAVPWNLGSDGSAVIAGLQYSPASYLRLALNYQDWFPYAANASNNSYLFVNFEFQF